MQGEACLWDSSSPTSIWWYPGEQEQRPETLPVPTQYPFLWLLPHCSPPAPTLKDLSLDGGGFPWVVFISSGSFIREALPLPGASVCPYNPPSMIFCTSRATTRITASVFHSLPEPWRMDEVRGSSYHVLPGTSQPWWYSLFRTDTRHYLCLHPAALSPSSTCRGLPRHCPARDILMGLQVK